jgi:alkylation response protein AidB-like acyl-CoA dehydrogenase
MDFELSKDQQLFADNLRRYLDQHYSFEQRRAILQSPAGWSRPIWTGLAELGLLGLAIPEQEGGLDAPPVEMLVTMTALGRALVVEPFLASAILATRLVCELGSPEQRQVLLPALAAGERIAVPAHGEAEARYDSGYVATVATRVDGEYALSGRKAVVLHAPLADHLLVSARTAGAPDDAAGISLFLVDPRARGVSLVAYPTLDGQRAADLTLRDVRVSADDRLGPDGEAGPALAAAWDAGVAALCAEAVGALEALLSATVEYAKTRKQFGVPIGTFQALQHRIADMFIQVEQARSMGYLASLRARHPDPVVRRASVSAAKVVVGRACRRVAQDAVQLHGGMGMADELAVSHYFRRLAAIELSLGDTDHHLERFRRSGWGLSSHET